MLLIHDGRSHRLICHTRNTSRRSTLAVNAWTEWREMMRRNVMRMRWRCLVVRMVVGSCSCWRISQLGRGGKRKLYRNNNNSPEWGKNICQSKWIRREKCSSWSLFQLNHKLKFNVWWCWLEIVTNKINCARERKMD